MQTAVAHSTLSADQPLLQAVAQRMREMTAAECAPDLHLSSVLAQAITHHMSSGGQQLRARLGLQAAMALGLSEADAVTLAATVEFIHNASLVHDDVQDRDRLRRGRSSVWAAFGDEVAICAGDMLLSLAYQALAQFSRIDRVPKLIAVAHAKIALAIAGQCADVQSRQLPPCALSAYEKIVAAKSGALLSLPLELALAAAARDQLIATARQAGDALSLGYQIMDDLDDVQDDRCGSGMAHSLNICLVLQAAGYQANAREKAAELGLRYLSQAQDFARRLPDGIGRCVEELAACLMRRF